MNKVDTQTQNATDSSHEFTHPPRVASQGDPTNAFKLMQVMRQTIDSALVVSLFVKQFYYLIANTIKALTNPPRATPQGDATNASKLMQVRRQTIYSTLVVSLSIKQFQYMIVKTIKGNK